MASGLTAEQAAHLERFLGPRWIAVLATVGGDGMPHLTPNWYAFHDGKMAISTQKESVKFTNLSRDDRIAVCVCSEPGAVEYATIRGRAKITDDESIWPVTRAIVERYVAPEGVEARMRELRKQNRIIISVTPDTVVFRT